MPLRLHPPGSHAITKVRFRRIKYPTYLVIVLRLLQELVERDLLTHGGSVVGILPSPADGDVKINESGSRLSFGLEDLYLGTPLILPKDPKSQASKFK